jgi:hypothetical protein
MGISTHDQDFMICKRNPTTAEPTSLEQRQEPIQIMRPQGLVIWIEMATRRSVQLYRSHPARKDQIRYT